MSSVPEIVDPPPRGSDVQAQKNTLRIHSVLVTANKLVPGVILAFAIAAIAILIGRQFGGPVMLYALVIGLAGHSFATLKQTRAGMSFAADTVLKIGVALLGVKITIVDIADLGFQTAGLVCLAVAATLFIGTWIGRCVGLRPGHAVLSAGAVAICGSSAALAISSVLPQNKDTECNTVVTIIVVTLLSTASMVLFPLVASTLNLSETDAGIFIGATIHNVAQVVGAGYMVSEDAGDISTVVKLMRVAFLLPVIFIIGLLFRTSRTKPASEKRPPLLPLFMIGFILIMLSNSFGYIPAMGASVLAEISRWALVVAIAALGVQTSLTDILKAGSRPVIALTLQTAFLATLVLVALAFILSI